MEYTNEDDMPESSDYSSSDGPPHCDTVPTAALATVRIIYFAPQAFSSLSDYDQPRFPPTASSSSNAVFNSLQQFDDHRVFVTPSDSQRLALFDIGCPTQHDCNKSSTKDSLQTLEDLQGVCHIYQYPS